MIIGHYIHHLEGQGGVEVYLKRIAGAQQAAGHTVYYFSKYTSPSDHNSAIAAETEASLYEQAKRLGVELLHLHASVSLAPPEDFVTIRTMHGHQAYCPSGSKYLKRQGTPCDRAYSLQGCLWGHLIDHCGSIRPHRLAENFQTLFNEKRILAKIPVLTNSEFVTEHMIAEGYPPHLIHTLYVCATEVAHVQEPPQIGIPHFAFLGRLVPEKGVVWLLRALAQVKVPVHLDIAGVGNQTATLQTMIQQLGLADRVTLHGWLNMEASYQLIQRSRALIFPSVWHEPAGLVAYEAMLNARATIASRVGGIPEGVLDGVTGLLVEPNDIAGLANHIERLATDWALAKQLGENGRRMAQQSFGLQNHMQKLMQFYEQVMRSSKDQPLGLSNCS
ncbi:MULTISPECIES: glycosyltransferase family 4 protein [Leptolyngbya]|uniref:glycosyltransferase family 4 protein n=1 Tax=Leptolyngbya TaxID=47251 RepID=UPI001683E8A3|nr:glycosyltransferase family 4 protein [Leptolyngbya sp. FACHB-1624]MBD1858313.1 glycosyltransferase family 4 protein [Leptolyngbya sp. FACHB-1624]